MTNTVLENTAYPHQSRHQKKITRLEKRNQRLNKRLKRLEKRISQVMTLRLLTGGGLIALAIVIAAVPDFTILGWLFIIGVAGFIALVLRFRYLKRFKNYLSNWKAYNERQLARLTGPYHSPWHKHTEVTKDTEQAILSRDLYLTGECSLFSLLDETFSQGGREKLKSWIFNNASGSHEDLESRQKLLYSLSRRRWRLEKLGLIGRLFSSQINSNQLENFLERSVFGPDFKIYWRLHWVFFPLAVILFILCLTNILPFAPAFPVVAYAIFALASLSEVSRSFHKTEDLMLGLENMHPVYDYIETNPSTFKNLTPSLYEFRPSQRIRPLKFILSALSLEGHWLVHLVINALMPWTYTFSYLAERWRLRHKDAIQKANDEIFELEATLSCALFCNYQTNTFPAIKTTPQFSVDQVYHPLLSRHHVVANSFAFEKDCKVALITGSNMSGKSTFLKTLGLNQQLALMGCPVFAKSMTTFPGPVLTCVQISDSLESGYSSFFYEVRRVQEIISRAQKGESFFYLVDEIFRGTNNRERLQGSRAVIEYLAHQATKTLGVISTHDLELTNLAESYSELGNWHFRDEVKNGELHFSYNIHEGPCPTTNALKIMAQEGLPVELPD